MHFSRQFYCRNHFCITNINIFLHRGQASCFHIGCLVHVQPYARGAVFQAKEKTKSLCGIYNVFDLINISCKGELNIIFYVTR
jgi:hypothetical protein